MSENPYKPPWIWSVTRDRSEKERLEAMDQSYDPVLILPL